MKKPRFKIPGPIVLTVPEVARYLRVTPKTVYDLVNKGRMKHRRIGRLIRIHRASLEAFLRRNYSGGARAD